MERCLTQRETANVLRCSERTLEKLRVSGMGPKYHKLLRRVLYKESDIEAWLAARVVRSTSEVGGVVRAS
jgi:predicted DNA-binding transcriptional regulator AlpA